MLLNIIVYEHLIGGILLLFLLFGVLWGTLLCLILCAPYSYYPLFFIFIAVSVVLFFLSKKHFKTLNRRYIIISCLMFILSYYICSYAIFKPGKFYLSDTSNVKKYKKAVIFYCEGEMEKYTPYYAGNFIEKVPYILKPVKSLKIKYIYRKNGVNAKNKDLIKAAYNVKNSLLNYKPYYFYIAFSSYFPGIADSVNNAIKDGCQSIIIINYTPDENLNVKFSKLINQLKSKGIHVSITKSVCSVDEFVNVFYEKIKNMPQFDGIIIEGNPCGAGRKLKEKLTGLIYNEDNVITASDIEEGISYFKDKNLKNILYVNLNESSTGILNIEEINKLKNPSSDIKLTGIDSWGFDKGFVKAATKVLINEEMTDEF